MSSRIIFLGTGGGRYVSISQTRATGGIYIIDGESRIHIDPGPGALIQLHRHYINPYLTDAVLVSHCHPDHYCDAEILIEAMTDGCRKRRGTLFASRSVIEGFKSHGPAVSKYHRSVVEECIVAHDGSKIHTGYIETTSLLAYHSDKSGVWFRMKTSGGAVVWGSDTSYELSLSERASADGKIRVLILSVTTPLGIRIPHHLNTKDAAAIVSECEPELCIITHFGVRMIESNVHRQAAWISGRAGVKTVAAEDGMQLNLGRQIRITRAR